MGIKSFEQACTLAKLLQLPYPKQKRGKEIDQCWIDRIALVDKYYWEVCGQQADKYPDAQVKFNAAKADANRYA